MSVYFVTGTLGAGKSLVAVGRIQQYLRAGRRVATNLNIRLDAMLPPSSKATIHRLPDKPRRGDLEQMGLGHDGAYDEDRFGLLVLDELATWFNSRNWNDKERGAVIDWFLHARKYQWDIIFLVQDIEAVDRQLRQALCEYLVVCRRTDRIPVPVLSSLARLVGITKVLPKGHVGTVWYGQSQSSGMKSDRWWYRGKALYPAYETRQVFSDQVDFVDGRVVDMRAAYTVLSPWHVRGRYLRHLSINWRRALPYLFLVVAALPAVFFVARVRGRSARALAKETGIWKPRSLSDVQATAKQSLELYREVPFAGV